MARPQKGETRRGRVALASLLTSLCALATVSAAVAPTQVPRVPREVLVRYVEDSVASDRTRMRGRVGARKLGEPRPGLERLELRDDLDLDEAIAILEADPSVRFAEPNYVIKLDATPDDPQYPSQWGLAAIEASAAWDKTSGTTAAVVAIVDTGVDWQHPDLAPNIWTNPGEIPDNGLDDDGNGYVDDIRGFDFLAFEPEPADEYGHGTHVAGIVGAAGNNGQGVAGVAWKVRIMPVKIFDSAGFGTLAGAVAGIRYAIDEGADVVNASWGFYADSIALREAAEDALEAGVLLVASAGNDSADLDAIPRYPAAIDLPNVLSVAASDESDGAASFTNFGALTVDLAAPGVNVLSTVPAGSYSGSGGTSAAAPHVSGVAALLRSARPEIGVEELAQRILESVDPLPAFADTTVTGGRLNAARALAELEFTRPSRVNDLFVAFTTSNTAMLGWTAPEDDGEAVAAYDLRWSAEPIFLSNFDVANRAAGAIVPGVPGSAERFEVVGLAPGATHYFALRSRDEWGNVSPLSSIVSAITLAAPIVDSEIAPFVATLPTGGSTTRTWEVRNASTGTLDFERVEGDTPDWIRLLPTEGRVSPLSTFPIAVLIDALGLEPGTYTHEITLRTNDPFRPEISRVVDLTVEDAPALDLMPRGWDAGSFLLGAMPERELVLKNVGTEPLDVSATIALPDWLHVVFETGALLPGESRPVFVRLQPDTVGDYEFELGFVSDAANASARFPVRAHVEPAPGITVSPEAVTVLAGMGRPQIVELTIANPGDGPLEVVLDYFSRIGQEALFPNGGFEYGDFSYWSATDNGVGNEEQWQVVEVGTTGSFYATASLGDAPGFAYRLERPIAVPAGVPSAALTYREQMALPLDIGEELIYPVVVRTTLRDEEDELLAIPSLQSHFVNQNWRTRSIDLTPYAGTTVTFRIDQTQASGLSFGAGRYDDFSLDLGGWPSWLAIEPSVLTVPPGGSRNVRLTVDANGHASDVVPGQIRFATNVPGAEAFTLPFEVVLAGAPALQVGGPVVTEVSQLPFEDGRSTSHAFDLPAGSVGTGAVTVAIAGKFNTTYARVYSEEGYLGSVDGGNCNVDEETFELTPGTLARMAEDGVTEVVVENDFYVSPTTCVENYHRVSFHRTPPLEDLDFGSTLVGHGVASSILLRNDGTDPLLVTGLQFDTPEIEIPGTVPAEVAPRTEVRVPFVWTPTAIGAVSGDLTLTTNDPVRPVFVASWHGEAAALPVLTVEPPSITAIMPPESGGEVASLTLTATGGAIAFELSGSADGFAVWDPLSATLAAGEEITFDVELSSFDLSAGSHGSSLTIVTEFGQTLEVPVTLEVQGGPSLSLGTPRVRREEADFFSNGQFTVHGFQDLPSSSRGLSVAVELSGDYAASNEFAQIVFDENGVHHPIGVVGGFGGGTCVSGAATFPVPDSDTYGFFRDGIVNGGVIPTSAVSATCPINRHVMELRFDEELTNLELPEISTAETASVAVRARNVGDEELTISDSSFDSPGWSLIFDTATIPPGGVSSGTLSFDPVSPGVEETTLVVTSNDVLMPVREYSLTIDVAGAPQLELSPASVSASIDAGETTTAVVTLENLGDGELTFTATAAAEWLTVEPQAGAIEPGGSAGLTLEASAVALVGGTHEGEITLETNDPASPVIAVPVVLQVTGEPLLVIGEGVETALTETYFEPSGAAHDSTFSIPLDLDEAIGAELTASRTGQVGFMSGPVATVLVAGVELGPVSGIAEGPHCNVASATFPVDFGQLANLLSAGVLEVRVENETADSTCPVRRHDVRFKLARPLDGPIVFPDVAVGLSEIRLLWLANEGTGPLTANLSSASPEFVPERSTLTLAPLTGTFVPIAFSPATVGSASAELVIETDVPGALPVVVTLGGAGTGTSPQITVDPAALAVFVEGNEVETLPLTVQNPGDGTLVFRAEVHADAPEAPVVPSVAPGPFAPIYCMTHDAQRGEILAVGGGRYLYRYDPGAREWSFFAETALDHSTRCGLAIAEDTLVVTSSTTSLFELFDLGSGEGVVAPISFGGGRALAVDEDGWVYVAATSAFVRWNPVTSASQGLAGFPFSLDVELSYFEGHIYTHRDAALLRYDILSNTWAALPQAPGFLETGATIDEDAREYIVRGVDPDVLYHYSIDEETWRVGQPVEDEPSSLVWTPGPIGSFYLGRSSDLEFFRFAPAAPFVQVNPSTGAVAPGGQMTLDVALDGADSVGTRTATILFASNASPEIGPAIPVTVESTGAPLLRATRVESVESVDTTFSHGTNHSLPVEDGAAPPMTAALTVLGRYADPDDTAELRIEGTTIGQAGHSDCIPDTETFDLDPAFFEVWAANGSLSASVQNNFFDPGCPEQEHRVRIEYQLPLDELDFGEAAVGAASTHTIRIANVGTEPLDVSLEATGAGFAGSGAISAIAPGEASLRDITLVPESVGEAQGLLRLTPSAGAPLEVPLTGFAVIGPDVAVTPTAISVASHTGAGLNETLTIGNVGDRPLQFAVELAEGAPDFLQLFYATGNLDPEETDDVLLVGNLDGLEGGLYAATLIVRSNDPSDEEVFVPVEIEVTAAADVSVSPSTGHTLNFGTVAVGETETRTITLSNAGTADLTAQGPTGSPQVQLVPGTVVVPPGASAEAQIALTAAEPGQHVIEVPILTNDPDEPEIVYNTLITVVAAPAAVAEPSVFDLELPIGARLDAAIELSHTGGGSFVVQSDWVPAAAWVAPLSPGSLEPGESLDVPVAVDTTGLPAGAYQTTATFRSTLLVEPLAAVPVNLEVFDAPDVELTEARRESSGIVPDGIPGATAHSFSVWEGATGAVVAFAVCGNHEEASVYAEGVELGTIGGTECGEHVSFTISQALFATLSADGTLSFEVVDDAEGASPNAHHEVRLDQLRPWPGAVDFGAVRLGEPATRSFHVRNAGTLDLSLGSLDVFVPGLTVELEPVVLAPGDGRTVEVALSARTEATIAVDAVLATNDPDELEVPIPIRAEIVVSPELSLTPAALTFPLPAGGKQTQTVELRSAGAAAGAFSVEVPANVAPYLSVTPQTGIVPAGGAVELAVEASAYFLSGELSTEVTIATSDPFQPVLSLAVEIDVTSGVRLVPANRSERGSEANFRAAGATTVHRFPVERPPLDDGELEVTVGGDYGYQEGAQVFLDGAVVGSAAAPGQECGVGEPRIFDVTEELRQEVVGGFVDVEVRNDAEVGAFCHENRHRVVLRYLEEIEEIEIGSDGVAGVSFVNVGSGSVFGNLSVSGPFSVSPTFFNSHFMESFVTLTAEGPGTFEGLLTISSNDAVEPERTIPITARIVDSASAAVRFEPSPLEVAVADNSLAESAITLVNDGPGPADVSLDVRSVPPSGALLAIDADSGTVYSGNVGTGASAVVGRIASFPFTSELSFPPLGMAADPRDGTIRVEYGSSVWYTITPYRNQEQSIQLLHGNFLSTLAYDPLRRLWTTTGSSLRRLNDAEDDFVESFTLTHPDVSFSQHPVRGLAFAPDGTLYASTTGAPGYLFTIDVDTRDVSLVASIADPSGAPIEGGCSTLAWGSDGWLYGRTDDAGTALARIDPATAIATHVPSPFPAEVEVLAAGVPYAPRWLVEPAAGPFSLEPGTQVDVPLRLDGSGSAGGEISAELIAFGEGVKPLATSPLLVTVQGTPRLGVTGERGSTTSVRPYDVELVHASPFSQYYVGTTNHVFEVDPAVDSLRAVVDLGAGQYHDVYLENAYLPGANTGSCQGVRRGYDVSTADTQTTVADGVVEVEVESRDFQLTCGLRDHAVTLHWTRDLRTRELGTVPLGALDHFTIPLESTGTAPVVVDHFETDLPGLGLGPLPLSLVPGAHANLTGAWIPAELGPFAGTLRLRTNDPDEPWLELTLSGEVVAPADIAFDPDPVRVLMAPGQPDPVTRTLAFGNQGQGTLSWSVSSTAVPLSPVAPGLWPVHLMPVSDGFDYVAKTNATPDGPVFAWADTTAPTYEVALTGDDETSPPIPLGFSFPFYGKVYPFVRVSTNGWLSFTSDLTTAAEPETLPSAAVGVPENLIAPFFDDLIVDGTARIRMRRDPTRVVVEYDGVRRYHDDAELSFQVWLESSGRIVFVYDEVAATSESAAIGIQNRSRDRGLLVAHHEDLVSSGLAIEITPVTEWLEVAPRAGTLVAGGLGGFDLIFDASNRSPGRYLATVDLLTNDPVGGAVAIPVEMVVGSPPDASVEVEMGGGSRTAHVTLDAGGSVDLDSTPGTADDIVSYRWFRRDGEELLPLGDGPTLSLTLSVGVHELVLEVEDRLGLRDRVDVVVDVPVPSGVDRRRRRPGRG